MEKERKGEKGGGGTDFFFSLSTDFGRETIRGGGRKEVRRSWGGILMTTSRDSVAVKKGRGGKEEGVNFLSYSNIV